MSSDSEGGATLSVHGIGLSMVNTASSEDGQIG